MSRFVTCEARSADTYLAERHLLTRVPMKKALRTVVAAALWGALATCGGGTLGGGNSGAGSTGVIGPGNPAGTGAAGASSGRGGSGGGGATGWEFGVGGSIGPSCPPQPVPACGSACGSGGIDACPGPAIPGCPGGVWREECDGADFGGDSCEQRGYGSGTLTCNSDCTMGTPTCSPCLATNSLVASCGAGPAVIAQFGAYSLAATDTEVALSVLQYGAGGVPSLLFQRLAPDLSVIGSTTVTLPSPSGPYNDTFGAVTAPLPSGGWVVGFCATPEIYFLTFDVAGRAQRRVVVSSSIAEYMCGESIPMLAARPDGGPLMLWRQEEGLVMSVIAADGLSASPPRTIVSVNELGWAPPSTAWVGGDFAVAVPIQIDAVPYPVQGLRLLRIAPDGTPSSAGDFLAGELEGSVAVAGGPDARDVRIVYTGVPTGGDFNTDYGMNWWRYDSTGATSSASIGPQAAVDLLRPASAVAFGDDTIVFAMEGYNSRFGILRVAADGRVLSPYRDVFRSPGYGGVATMVRRGSELVVSIDVGSTIYLARLTP
jgi:hypothetical protein